MTFVNYQGGSNSTRKVSDVFNVYVKTGSTPKITHQVLQYEGSTVHVLKVHPSETTAVHLDYAGDSPKYVPEIRNEYMMANGWIHAAGINAGYFNNNSNQSAYGQPVGAVLTDWAKTWSAYKSEPCYPCKDKGYPTIYSDGYSLSYKDAWADEFTDLLGKMLWARGVGQSLTIEEKVDCSIGQENGRYNASECVSMVGIDKDGNWLLVANTIKGLNHLTRSYLMNSLGAVTSFDLDGGGSTQLWWNDDLVNQTPDPVTPDPGGTETMMNGIDISNWQKGLDLDAIKADFVIMKATEGLTYTDPTCNGFYAKAKAGGKKLGLYHFARPETNTAEAEANYFVNAIKNYVKTAILVLDWESSGKANVTWAKAWLDKVYALTGVKPMIYMSESVVNAYDWSKVVAGDYGLWVAKYRDSTIDKNYDMTNAGTKPSVKWWNGYAMWQWTSKGLLDGYSGDLDCDAFYGDKSAWDAYAGSTEPDPVDPDPEDPTVAELEEEIEKLNTEITGLEGEVKDLNERITNAQKALKGE